MGGLNGNRVSIAPGVMTGNGSSRDARFALTKFRPPALPATLITRSVLHDRLTAGADQRVTIVVGSAGAGKSVLLSDWAATRPPGLTSWLSCDKADADPVRFWAGFIRAPRSIEPGFGADAAELLAVDRMMSADITALVANDAARLPAGSAVVVDDFHYAAAATAADMTELVERWPADNVQLVLAGRFDPPLRQHRLRLSDQLREIRDSDLYFSLTECRGLLANFGVQISDTDLTLLHQQSEGWPAVLQMAALSLRGTTDRTRLERVLEVRGQAIAEYFVSEVLDQQPAAMADFMLDTSILGALTVDACAAVTGQPDAAALLRAVETAHLFLVPLDDERTSFRYHPLVRRILRAELCARDRAREHVLQLRAAEWSEASGDIRRAAHHYLAAQEPDQALALLQDRVVADFMRAPATHAPMALATLDPSLLVETPERLLGLAAELLLSGDTARGGEYLDRLEQAGNVPAGSRLAARFAAFQAFRYGVTGQLEKAVWTASDARAIQQRTRLADEWNAVVPLILIRVHICLHDLAAADREAETALAEPDIGEPVRLVMVPGSRALAWFDAGYLTRAAVAASGADTDARRLGFSRHFFAVDYLRALSGLALERRDFGTAEQLTGRVLAIAEQRQPLFEFLALLDLARIWAARGQVRDALATLGTAREAVPGASASLLAWADEQEALLRLSLGDLRSAADLASGLPTVQRGLLRARIALSAGDHQSVPGNLADAALGDLTPRQSLVRQVLLAAAAIERGDPAAMSMFGSILHTARDEGFLNTVVTTAPQVTGYVVEHAAQLRPDSFVERLVAAALEVRAALPPGAAPSSRVVTEPLTAAEQRILTLLPTSSYLQIADTLYISRNTVKTHLRSIYQKLGVASRSEALERAVDLRLL